MNHQLRLQRKFVISFVIAFALWLLLAESSVYQDLERIGLDYRFRNWSAPSTPVKDVVMLDIDEASLKIMAKDLGRWPWPRFIYKDLLEFVAQGNPRTIMFDILFTEPEINPHAQSPEDSRKSDQELAQVTSRLGIVSHAIKFENQSIQSDGRSGVLPSQVIERAGMKWRNSQRPRRGVETFKDFNIPTDLLLSASPHFHIANADKDSDGIVRRMPLFFLYQKEWYPSMTLKALSVGMTDPTYEYQLKLLKIYDGTKLIHQIPLDEDDYFKLSFYKSPQAYQFAFASFAMDGVLAANRKILSGEVDDPEKLSPNPLKDFAEKYVLVGGSAAGLEDLKATPIDSKYPGVLLHATAISNILQQQFLVHPPRWVHGLWVLVVLGLICFFLTYPESMTYKIVLSLLIIICHVILSIILFRYKNLQLDLVGPSFIFLGTLGEGLAYLTFVEGKRRKNLTGTLSKYLSPEVTKYLVDHGINPSAEVGKKQELTIFFSDVREFTSMSEKIEPEKLVAILNDYLGRMTELVFANQGTLDKYIGDAIMAFWGAPLENQKHAVAAVNTAFKMVSELEKANKDFQLKYNLQLKMGIGINSGSVIVGNIGCERRLDYTVIGDNVNLASRLEGLTKYYGVPIIIGSRTRDLIESEIVCRLLDWVQVKGKAEPTPIYQPIAKVREMTPHQMELNKSYRHALELYRVGQFAEAQAGFLKVYLNFPEDEVSQKMAQRCRELKDSPPVGWHGVFQLKDK